MTNDQIIELARQSGLVRVGEGWSEPARWGMTEIQRFAELVRNAAIDECVSYVRNQGFGTIASNAMKERLKS